MDLKTPVKILLRHGIHHDGSDYSAGDVLEVPGYQAIAYVQQGRAQPIDPLPGVPPLTPGAVQGQDPVVDHGSPAAPGVAPAGKSGKAKRKGKTAE